MTETKNHPVRLITTVWGETYLNNFMSICLPALLSNGNLPSLARHFKCELVIVTEERYFPLIQNSAIYETLQKYCDVNLVIGDDLFVNKKAYGHSLTFAFHRAFEDLGDKISDYYLLFFFADFILADGCYSSLIKHMLAGERLILAPSYCTVSQAIRPVFLSKVDPENNVLSIPKREMSDLILKYRHNTVQSKIINRPLLRYAVTDQFYWMVDGETILGYQFPVSIVCMRPERCQTEPISFWDYATVSTMCPTLNRCVLGDSDDFVMAELRDRDTLSELIEIGKSSPAMAANALGKFMTSDQIELGHHPLTLHSSSLPSNIAEERHKLKSYVDDVRQLLPKTPVRDEDHPYWTKYSEDFKTGETARSDKKLGEVKNPNQAKYMDVEFQDNEWIYAPCLVTQNASESLLSNEPVLGFFKKIYKFSFGILPRVTMFHPYWANLHRAVNILDAEKEKIPLRTLILKSSNSLINDVIEKAPGTHISVLPSLLQNFLLPPKMGGFNLCVIELNWQDFQNLKKIYSIIRAKVLPGGKIIIIHESDELKKFNKNSVLEIIKIIPVQDLAVINFTGSKRIYRAIKFHRKWLERAANRGRWSPVVLGVSMFFNSFRCYLGNLVEKKSAPYEFPNRCTGITIEITIP